MPQRLTIQDMQEIARNLNGKCLSKEYINSVTPLKWMCEKGHTWDRTYSVVQQGLWCSQCLKNENWFEKLKEIAEKKDGQYLSERYVNIGTKYKWQCKEGHVFALTGTSIKNGVWCKTCTKAQQKEKELSRLKLFAKKQGGLCLSSIYVNKYSRLKWQCSEGHIWFRQASNIKRGNWCKDCRRNEICGKELKKLQLLAQKKGGLCLSTSFSRIDSNLKWQCAEGHIFLSIPKNIKKGHWCGICSRKSFNEKLRYPISVLQAHAKKQGGKMLSEKYINSIIPIKWQCKEGHTWLANASSVLIAGSWCRRCHIESRKAPIEKLQKIAQSKKGVLLSEKYINSKTHLNWQCHKGHIWSTSPNSINRGAWCPTCNIENRSAKLTKKNAN